MARKPGRRGERAISRKPLRREGRDVSGEPVVTNSCAFYFRTRGCGCLGHPAFPAPSVFLREMTMQTSGEIVPRECWGVTPVIARSEATKQSILSLRRAMDCFASLAMRWRQLCHTGSAIEYFTWESAKLDSIEAMPSSRVSLVFKNAS